MNIGLWWYVVWWPVSCLVPDVLLTCFRIQLLFFNCVSYCILNLTNLLGLARDFRISSIPLSIFGSRMGVLLFWLLWLCMYHIKANEGIFILVHCLRGYSSLWWWWWWGIVAGGSVNGDLRLLTHISLDQEAERAVLALSWLTSLYLVWNSGPWDRAPMFRLAFLLSHLILCGKALIDTQQCTLAMPWVFLNSDKLTLLKSHFSGSRKVEVWG